MGALASCGGESSGGPVLALQTEADRDDARRLRQREYNRRYRERHADEIRARGRAYYHAHREEIATRTRERWRANPSIRERERKYRNERRDERNASDRARGAKKRRWFYANLRVLKEAQGCSDCGTRSGRLHHHHVDPSTKHLDVTKMWDSSIEAFMDEVAKCTVLCLPCHNKRHWAMRKAAA